MNTLWIFRVENQVSKIKERYKNGIENVSISVVRKLKFLQVQFCWFIDHHSFKAKHLLSGHTLRLPL